MNFQNKAVLITGGSSGIGLATAHAFARRGARVWLLARRREYLEQATCELQLLHPGIETGFVAADVRDPEQVNRAVNHVIQAGGLPDIVVNSAGITRPGYYQDLNLSVFRDMMDVNYFGTLNVINAVTPGMMERRSGHIVNISSLAGFLGVLGYSAYGPSKYAVRGLSDVLRAELKPYGVYVSIVYPFDTDTPQLAYEDEFKPPETRALGGGVASKPEDVAEAILKGVVHRSYTITPGFEATMYYWLTGHIGDMVYPIMDLVLARVRRKLGKSGP